MSRDEDVVLGGSLASNTSALGSSDRIDDASVGESSLCDERDVSVSGRGGLAGYLGAEWHCHLKSKTAAPWCWREIFISGCFNFDCVFFDVDRDKRFINLRSFSFVPVNFPMISAVFRFVLIRRFRPLSQRATAKCGLRHVLRG